jgi:hypothetical protein
MKHFLSIVSFLLIGHAALLGQSFVVSNTNATGGGSIFLPSFEAKVTVRNNTSQTLPLRWVRRNENTPYNWETAVCDEQCYTPQTSARSLTLLPGQTRTLRVNFYHRGVSGFGSTDLVLYNPYDSTNTSQTISFSGNAGSVSSNNNISNRSESQTIKVFPNPPTNYIQIDENDVVRRIEIYNAIGRKLLSYNVESSGEKYSISALPSGMYFVRLIDKGGDILFTHRITKYTP